MNKLFPITLAALLCLGGLLWFAASNSMSEFLQLYSRQISQQLPNSQVHFGDTKIAAQNGQGQISTFTLKYSLPNDNDKAANNESITLKLKGINWQFDKKTLKKPVQEVDLLTIAQVEISLPNVKPLSKIELINNAITHLLNNQQTLSQSYLYNPHELKIKVNKITVEKLHLVLQDKDQPIQEIIASNLTLDSALYTEQPMGLLGTKIIEELLIHAKAELKAFLPAKTN